MPWTFSLMPCAGIAPATFCFDKMQSLRCRITEAFAKSGVDPKRIGTEMNVFELLRTINMYLPRPNTMRQHANNTSVFFFRHLKEIDGPLQ